MASSESNHPYHLVNPSKWPFVGSLAGFIMATGGIYYMHDGSIFAFLAGTALMLYVMYGWWSDVISEAEGGAAPSPRNGFWYDSPRNQSSLVADADVRNILSKSSCAPNAA